MHQEKADRAVLQSEVEWRPGPTAVLWTVIVILIVALSLSGGCIKAVQKYAAHNETSLVNVTRVNVTEPLPDATPDLLQGTPVVQMTAARSAFVTEVTPYQTPDPYPVLHGTRINDTPQYNRLLRGIEFVGRYNLRGNATGLLANVVQGPFYIMYVVVPQHDCMMDPESCRGTAKAPVNRPWMTITVRDNQTQEVVTEDGYGREYSSDLGYYEFHASVQNADGSTSSYTSTTQPRYIALYRSGVYHITLEGNFIDTYVAMETGNAPTLLDLGNGDQSDLEYSPNDKWWV
jgi:hypothetical protein